MFSEMLRLYKVANGGTEMVRNAEFVISIDCDTVVPELQRRAEIGDTGNGGVFFSFFFGFLQLVTVVRLLMRGVRCGFGFAGCRCIRELCTRGAWGSRTWNVSFLCPRPHPSLLTVLGFKV